MPPPAPVRICFVCSGNICRSPTAEVVLTAVAGDRVVSGSAGIGDWHVGQDMDARSRATLVEHGYAPGRHDARQFRPNDFDAWDVVVALDESHRDTLFELADAADDPHRARQSIVLLRAFDPLLRAGEPAEVGDPYYGGASGFTTSWHRSNAASPGSSHTSTTGRPRRRARAAGRRADARRSDLLRN